MIIVAHRGNYHSKDEANENSSDYIASALEDLDIYVEADIWYQYGSFYLGHDEPTEQIDLLNLFEQHKNRMFLHAKNMDAAVRACDLGFMAFMHDNEPKVKIANSEYEWTADLSGEQWGSNVILAANEHTFKGNPSQGSLAGICTDNALTLKTYYENLV